MKIPLEWDYLWEIKHARNGQARERRRLKRAVRRWRRREEKKMIRFLLYCSDCLDPSDTGSWLNG